MSFAAAVDVLFADPHLAADAVYRPAGGDARPVRVVPKRRQEEVAFGTLGFRAGSVAADLRTVEVAAPAAGDRLEIAGASYMIVSAEPDALGLVHTLTLRPA